MLSKNIDEENARLSNRLIHTTFRTPLTNGYHSSNLTVEGYVNCGRPALKPLSTHDACTSVSQL